MSKITVKHFIHQQSSWVFQLQFQWCFISPIYRSLLPPSTPLLGNFPSIVALSKACTHVSPLYNTPFFSHSSVQKSQLMCNAIVATRGHYCKLTLISWPQNLSFFLSSLSAVSESVKVTPSTQEMHAGGEKTDMNGTASHHGKSANYIPRILWPWIQLSIAYNFFFSFSLNCGQDILTNAFSFPW